MKQFNFLFRTLLLGGIFLLFSLTNLYSQNNWEVNGNGNYETWSIFLDNVTIDGNTPDDGDTLAIFVDGDTPVGIYAFDGTEDFTGDYQTNYEMIAFSQLSGGDGYNPGDVVTFKFWDNSQPDSITGNFNESVLLDNPGDPSEYLDDGDGTLEYPSGNEPYSYVSLDFISGATISGTLQLDQDCFTDVSQVEITAWDTTYSASNPAGATNPNINGDYSLNGLEDEDSTYVVRYSLTNYFTVFDTIKPSSSPTGNDTTLIAYKGFIDLTLLDGLTSDSIETATVKLHYKNDSSLIATSTSVTDSITRFRFDSVCVGNYFIAVAKSNYISDTVNSVAINSNTDTTTRTQTLYRESGTVLIDINDASTGDDVTGALVESGDSTASEDNGIYTLTKQFGEHDITVSKDGYQNYTFQDFELTPGDTITQELNLAPVHFQFDGGNSNQPVWTIYISSAKLDEVNLSVNDELAIYDDGDTLVGTYFVEQDFTETDTLDRYIKAYSQLANGDEGYSDDDTYYVRIYDYSAGQELEPNTLTIDHTRAGGTEDPSAYDADSISPGAGTFPPDSIDPAYSYLNLTYLSDQDRNYNLNFGYQMISTNVDINDNNDSIQEVFDPILANLELVKNETGNTFREILSTWVNSIGRWGTTEGYLVKMEEDDQLTVSGTPIADLASNKIPLNIGFSIISYLPTTEQDARTVFEQGLGVSDLDNSALVYVRNSDADHLWKVGGTWKNNIGNLKPGEGYLVKMNAQDTLDYSLVTSKSASAVNNNDPVFFPLEGGNPTDMIYTMYISSDNLQAGDEVAAYCDGKLVGSTVIQNPGVATDNNLNIFRTLAKGEGFEPGSDVTLKVWSPRTNTLYPNPEVEYKNPSGEAWMKTTYPSEDVQISFVDLSVKALGMNEGVMASEINAYPNPADNKLHIESAEKISEIRVTNAVGQVLISREVHTNDYILNTSRMQSGIYILEATINGNRSSLRFAVK